MASPRGKLHDIKLKKYVQKIKKGPPLAESNPDKHVDSLKSVKPNHLSHDFFVFSSQVRLVSAVSPEMISSGVNIIVYVVGTAKSF